MTPRNAAPQCLVDRFVAVPCHAALLARGSPPATCLRAASVTPPPRRLSLPIHDSD